MAKAQHPAEKWLGKEVREAASGVTGICSSVNIQTNGNVGIGIQPPSNSKKAPPPRMFDQNIVDLVGPGISARVPPVQTKPDFAIGAEVEHITSDYVGVVVTHAWHLNGCVAYVVASPKTGTDGKPVHSVFFNGELHKGKARNKAVAEAPKTRTGGPVTAAAPGFR